MTNQKAKLHRNPNIKAQMTNEAQNPNDKEK
jgi:hypothetical protein